MKQRLKDNLGLFVLVPTVLVAISVLFFLPSFAEIHCANNNATLFANATCSGNSENCTFTCQYDNGTTFQVPFKNQTWMGD